MTTIASSEKSPRLVVAVIVLDFGSVLLLKRSSGLFAGRWCLPGGGVMLGESMEWACKRELFEETGLHCDHFHFVRVTETFGPAHMVGLVHRTDYFSGKSENREPDRHSDIGWFHPRDLPSPLMEPTREALAELFSQY